ncbi:MAG TPA: response regulator [Chitinophaga sp.]
MILIVDDKPENILSLKKTLELYNFEVDTALSGEEALKKILRNNYILIILDVQMPSMDGFEVAEAISGYSKAKDVPIIFLSAVNKDKKFVTRGYASGGIDYITKPVDPDILLLKVKTFYKLYEQTKQLSEMQVSLQEEIDVRKQAQASLNDTVRELHSILESIPQIAFTATADGALEYANQHWYAYSPDLHSWPETLPGQPPVAEQLARALASGQAVETEVFIKRLSSDHKSGKADYRCHLLRVTPVKEGAQTVKWVGTFTDIAHQKQANEILEQRVQERTEALQAMNLALEVSNHDLQQFASVASHDLKEPLRKIQLFSSILRDRHLHRDDESLQYIARIINSSERMSKLINDLLGYSRLSVDSVFEPVHLNQTITDILSDLELSIQEKEAHIIVADIPQIEAIPGQMRQVFQNIISNSLKFSKKGVRPEIHISATLVADKDLDAAPDPQGAWCRILIQDNGIGFNEKYLDKIFTIFQRLNTREEYEGTGIGLAIAKKVIEKHQGLISARSQEGEGATFILLLPVHQPHGNRRLEEGAIIRKGVK